MSQHSVSAQFASSSVETMHPCMPMSPPTTDSSDHHGQSAHGDYLTPRAAITHDIPLPTSKKTSTLAYHTPFSSNPFGHREKQNPPKSRAFIMVVPPARLADEHGQLGHTLSTGPADRISQGMLMPLFSTVYAQLTAIAKEWAFPSISGLCLYMHITENGITFTPRICDETWPMLWHHALEPSNPSIGLPIVGRIEFDIDLFRAKWFNAWCTSRAAEPKFIISHSREVSKDSSNFTQEGVEAKTQASTKTARSRHVPKTLSLVDRFDRAADSKPTVKPSALGAAVAMPTDTADDLTAKVNQWRGEAHGASSKETETVEAEQLNLDDFRWSPSTLGPPTGGEAAYEDSPRAQSIHLDRRMGSSVCNTPSVCTSFGPDDDEDMHVYSPAALRTPYPNRYALESKPNTPLTAAARVPPAPLTPSDELQNPVRRERVFSWPYYEAAAPAESEPVASTSDAPSWPYYSGSSEPSSSVAAKVEEAFSWPYYSVKAAAPASTSAYPYLEVYAPVYPHIIPYPSVAAEHKVEVEAEDSISIAKFSTRYPHFNLYPAAGYPHFDLYPQPYFSSEVVESSPSVEYEEQSGSSYPWIQVYSPVYPHIVPYPPIALDDKKAAVESSPVQESPVQSSSSYPWLQIYAPVYPHIVPYPSIALDEPVKHHSSLKASTREEYGSYPWLQIYAPVYPFLAPYPETALVEMERCRDVSVESSSIQACSTGNNYPWLQIYAPVYPHIVPYPAVASELYSDLPPPRPRQSSLRSRSGSVNAKRRFMLPLSPSENPWPEHSHSATLPRSVSYPSPTFQNGTLFDPKTLPSIASARRAPLTPTDPSHRRHKSSELPAERPLPKTVSHLRAQSVSGLERSKSTSSVPPARPPRMRDSMALTMEKLRKARSMVPGSPVTIPQVLPREVSFFEDSDEE